MSKAEVTRSLENLTDWWSPSTPPLMTHDESMLRSRTRLARVVGQLVLLL